MASTIWEPWEPGFTNLEAPTPTASASPSNGPSSPRSTRTDLGRSNRYGLTYPMSTGGSGPSYLEIDNDFENGVFGSARVCEGYTAAADSTPCGSP